ncbi:FtsK/SpoIIIE domain-containing protein, partial [Staphylococcus epidermidis]|uniref:FtsK/SpoIIIE domain-containing protein n=1 Tax=Staphylococcus epidermidis TaxID=1282 RepID=UPI0028CB8DC1
KSVSINTILISLLYKNHPQQFPLLLIHPKILQLPPYNHLPHLLSPLITHLKPPTQTLKSPLQQIQKPYKFFPQYHLTNITPFNKKPPYHQTIPKILIVIDNLANLIMIPPQHLQQS